MNIKITADSTCDLSPELAEKYNVGVVPLHIVRGDESLRDGVEIFPKDIFEYVDSGAGVCTTAAVNALEYHKYFSTLLREYDAIVHIDISSELSVCNQNARLAAAELENVYVVDSRSLSTGAGLLVLDAALLAGEGVGPARIKELLDERAGRLNVSFVLDTLKYLRKGGRCSAVAALGANMLSLRPCIEVKNGKMDLGKKYRGGMDRVLVKYVEDRLKGRDDIDCRRIFITDSGVSPEVYERVYDAVRACGPFEEILSTQAGCTISNHCGPKCLGILYFNK